MMQNWKKGGNLWLIPILVLLACESQEKKESYYFEFTYEEDSIPSYYEIREIVDKDNQRVEHIANYDRNKQIEDKDVNRFLVDSEGLKKKIGNEYRPFLSIENNDCIEFGLGDQHVEVLFGTEICYLGKENVIIGNKSYEGAYKFKKVLGEIDGVESVMYLDKNFILIKEEYVSGYTAAYCIKRLNQDFR